MTVNEDAAARQIREHLADVPRLIAQGQAYAETHMFFEAEVFLAEAARDLETARRLAQSMTAPSVNEPPEVR